MKISKIFVSLSIITFIGVNNLTNAAPRNGIPECLNKLARATSVDEDNKAPSQNATENHKAYLDASGMVNALEVSDLEYVLKEGIPAGRVYAAVLLKQSGKVGNNLSFDKLLGDNHEVIYKSSDKVIHTTVAKIARSFIDKGAYENFSFSIFCKLMAAPKDKN